MASPDATRVSRSLALFSTLKASSNTDLYASLPVPALSGCTCSASLFM
jgi:hypothetical protein